MIIRTKGIHVRYLDRRYGNPGIVEVAFSLCGKEICHEHYLSLPQVLHPGEGRWWYGPSQG
jgi:hypothetical protein